MDWHKRKVKAWRLSHTLDPAFYADASGRALARNGAAQSFSTDQEAKFTSNAFNQVLKVNQTRL